jgi:hypothetical protein
MKSIYFLLYSTQKGARHGVYAGAFARKTASPKNPKGLSSDQGRRPIVDHLLVPVVLSSSQSTPENKKSSRKVQGVPKAPAKDQPLVSNPREGARTRRCIKHPREDSHLSRKAKDGRITEDQPFVSNPREGARLRRCIKHLRKDSPLSRKAKHGRITEDQPLVSNPREGARTRQCIKHPWEDSPLSRKAERGRIIEHQGRSDHLAKETQIRRSAPGPSPREQPLTRCRRSLGSLKRRRFHVREGPASLNVFRDLGFFVFRLFPQLFVSEIV